MIENQRLAAQGFAVSTLGAFGFGFFGVRCLLTHMGLRHPAHMLHEHFYVMIDSAVVGTKRLQIWKPSSSFPIRWQTFQDGSWFTTSQMIAPKGLKRGFLWALNRPANSADVKYLIDVFDGVNRNFKIMKIKLIFSAIFAIGAVMFYSWKSN